MFSYPHTATFIHITIKRVKKKSHALYHVQHTSKLIEKKLIEAILVLVSLQNGLLNDSKWHDTTGFLKEGKKAEKSVGRESCNGHTTDWLPQITAHLPTGTRKLPLTANTMKPPQGPQTQFIKTYLHFLVSSDFPSNTSIPSTLTQYHLKPKTRG